MISFIFILCLFPSYIKLLFPHFIVYSKVCLNFFSWTFNSQIGIYLLELGISKLEFLSDGGGRIRKANQLLQKLMEKFYHFVIPGNHIFQTRSLKMCLWMTLSLNYEFWQNLCHCLFASFLYIMLGFGHLLQILLRMAAFGQFFNINLA